MTVLASVFKSMKSQDVEQLCRRVMLATAVIIGCVAADAALGQSPAATTTAATAKDATPQTHPNDPMLWNVDRMMEDAVQQISKRYSLNSEQEKYTRLMLTQRVRAFLKDHEADVRALLKEQIDWKAGFKPETSESRQVWATKAKPLYAEAMKAILDGNKEWGDILNDEQKKIHLGDMNQMKVNFDSVNSMLNNWESGNSMVTPPRTPTDNSGPIRQPAPPPPTWQERKIEDMWETYVIRFIQIYGLDEKQKNAAHSIKRETQGEAAKYRESRKSDFDELFAMSGSDARKPTNPEETRKRKQSLERPIREMFGKMTGRLDGLLSQSQRESAKPEDKELLESIAKNFRSDSTVPIREPKPEARPTTKVAPDGGVTRASATSVPAAEPKEEKPTEKAAPAKPEAGKPADDSAIHGAKDADSAKPREAASEKEDGKKKPD